jgi:DNA-binding CsgD family transcriptional regulator
LIEVLKNLHQRIFTTVLEELPFPAAATLPCVFSIPMIVTLILAILILLWQKSKIQKNKKIANLVEENLTAELKFKSKEIVNFALHINEKDDFLENLRTILSQATGVDEAKQIKALINQNLSMASEREIFKDNVDQVSEVFFMKLDEKFPKLTKNDKRLCALLRLNLSSKEIASVQNIAPSSVDISRHRLRKKLNLASDVNFSEFMNTI